MLRVDDILDVVNESLDSKPKRHIIGGILMSVSFLFCGLAFTVMTLKSDYKENGV